jgi:metal-responsive CopG/Arc/MetJ family transcriptional regulator
MAQITLRLDDDLLDDLDDDLDPEETRSERIRTAIRNNLNRPDHGDRLDDLERRIKKLEQLHDTPWYRRWP